MCILHAECAVDIRRMPVFPVHVKAQAGDRWRIPRERVEDETADVFIAVLNYADARGIDLARVVAEKLRTIEARRLERAGRGEVY